MSRPDKCQAPAVSDPTGSEIQMAKGRWRKNDTRILFCFLLYISWSRVDAIEQIKKYLSYTLLNYTKHPSIKSNLSHPAKQFVSNDLFRATCTMKPWLNEPPYTEDCWYNRDII